MELIDREKLQMECFGLTVCPGYEMQYISAMYDKINNAPTIDAVPVVHGQWKWKQGIAEDDYMLICSACTHPSNSYYDEEYGGEEYIRSNFCPNCGCKMSEGRA